jgi:2-polyprenyl-3-methyl-5-hydroxy-6-metoxy-1,4-benzoquinol methylase
MKLNTKINLTLFDYITFNSCALCGSNNIKKIECIENEPEVNYFFCKDCQVNFTDKQLTVKSTKDLYLNYFDNHQLKTGIESSLLGEHLYNFFKHKNFSSKSLKILDFGGGDGSIVKYFANQLETKNDFNNTILDVFDVYECEKKLDGVNYLSTESDIEINKYDIIIASAVLEHLNSPLSNLQLLFNALKKNGYFYARTPYRLPLRFLISKISGKKIGMQFPWHLFDMGRPFWNHLPSLIYSKFGLEVKIELSQPSLVQSPYKENRKKFIFAKLLKMPGYVFKNWNYVGGWEVFIKKV